jgi:hypothetical protein
VEVRTIRARNFAIVYMFSSEDSRD